MKILAYLHSYPPMRFVGGEMMTARLLEELVTAGHEVTVCAEKNKAVYVRNGVCVTYASDVRKSEFDLLITHPEIKKNIWAGASPETPYIGIVHNLSPGTLLSLQALPPDLTIANSAYTAEAIGHVYSGRLEVIHPPVSLTGVSTGEAFTMVNVSYVKGGRMLAELARANPDQQFVGVIGGHGGQHITPGRDNLRYVKAGDNMSAVYSKTKALLFPTRSETYGMVVAEAMMYGIPVVASDLPGVREAGGDAPTYLSPIDFFAWDREVKRISESDGDHHYYMSNLSRRQAVQLRWRAKQELERWVRLVEEMT